jgi:predicted nucleotidyltransferase/lambda repressor-like predicted transcriptional regulator
MKKPIVPNEYRSRLRETVVQKVAEVFFRYPEKEFSLNDLAREAGVSKSNLNRILNYLHRTGIIEIVKLSKIWRIRANQKGWNFIKNKIAYNISSIYQSGIIEFLNSYYGNPKSIVLFGSYRRGEDVSSSDIDIAIETTNANKYETRGLRETKAFEERLGRKIQIHLFNRKNVDINVFNNIANGIVLSGFLEVRP